MHSIAWWPTCVVLAIATFTDLRSRRIPNWLVFPFMADGPWNVCLASRMAGIPAESGGLWPRRLDFWCLLRDGRNGNGRREALRGNRRMGWPVATCDCFGDHGTCRGRDGCRLGGLARISGPAVRGIRRTHPGIERARLKATCGLGPFQPEDPQNAVRAGHRDWNVNVIFRALSARRPR